MRLLGRVLASVVVVDLIAGTLASVFMWVLLAALEIPSRARWSHVGLTYWIISAVSLASIAFALSRDPRAIADDLGGIQAPADYAPPLRRALETARLVTGVAPTPTMYVLSDRSVNAFVASSLWGKSIIGVTQGLIDGLDERQLDALFIVLLARIDTWDSQLVTALSHMRKPARYLEDFSVGLLHPFMLMLWLIASVGTMGYERTCALSAERADAEALLRFKDPREMSRALLGILELEFSMAGPAVERWPGLFFIWPIEESPTASVSWKRRLQRLSEVAGSEWEQKLQGGSLAMRGARD